MAFFLDSPPSSAGPASTVASGQTTPRVSFAEVRDSSLLPAGASNATAGGLGIRFPSGIDFIETDAVEQISSAGRPQRPMVHSRTMSTLSGGSTYPLISASHRKGHSTRSPSMEDYYSSSSSLASVPPSGFNPSGFSPRRSISVRQRQRLSMSLSPSSSIVDFEEEQIERPGEPQMMTVSREQLMAEHIYRRAQTLGWIPSVDFGIVAVRVSVGHYVTFPLMEEVDGADVLLDGLRHLNCAAAILTGTHVVERILRELLEDESVVAMSADLQVQVLDDIISLASAKRFQHAAFIRSTQSLAMWTDNVRELLAQIETMQDAMMDYIYSGPATAGASEKLAEKADVVQSIRPSWHQAPLMGGLSTGLNIFLACATIRKILIEYLTDGEAMRFLILICLPFQFAICHFFLSNVVGIIFQVLGPVAQMHRNTKYYSGVRPVRMAGELPHITVQMPVYKESLEGVIRPTVESLQAAMKTYELQGGTASIFVNDDGMQSLGPEALRERKTYYDENSIAFVARPAHSEHFHRAGRFKKASNMNHGLELSIQVEKLMNLRRPAVTAEGPEWDADQEDELYAECLAAALAMSAKEIVVKDWSPAASTAKTEGGEEEAPIPSGWRGRSARKALAAKLKADKEKAPDVTKIQSTWAEGNIRMGELILIIDSDTRVPVDCFLDGASEFAASPELAILQHESGVMKVANHYFENGIAFFTSVVNLAISLVCANGDVAPFVGHNAFIRWSALQEVAIEVAEGRKQIWSECHVSEDFDMALRMLNAGYDVRWASYSNGEFEEGVSLSAEDEINRWQKYAYGCSELVFNPIRYWPTRGPFTKQILRFLCLSKLPVHYKFSSMGYIFSYYAIACAIPMTILNYVIIGLYDEDITGSYLPSWNALVALWVVFSAASPLAYAILKYRCGKAGLLEAIWQQIIWLPFFLVFFGGLSYHISLALMSHLVGYNMTWSATEKDVKDTTVMEELPHVFRRFWPMISFFTILLAGVIVMSTNLVPFQWQITQIFVIIPLLCTALPHLLYITVLNPYLARLKF